VGLVKKRKERCEVKKYERQGCAVGACFLPLNRFGKKGKNTERVLTPLRVFFLFFLFFYLSLLNFINTIILFY
jgi:hypothetical protein